MIRRGGAAALRSTSASGFAAKPPGARQVFSAATCLAGARGVLRREAPLGHQAHYPFSARHQGAAAGRALFGNGTMTTGGTIWGTLRQAMVKQRRVPLLNTTTNLSNQCGHLSFIVLALAYLETDVLALRGYAASGIGLSILFQFYRPQPLWIPIGWNAVFLLINTSMIGLLLKEKNEAANVGNDPEQVKLFEEVFKRVELTLVDFVRLMDVAERREVPKGARLSQEGRVQEEVFLIVEGAAQVEAEGAAVGHLEQEQFVGSMAFNRFIQSSPQSASESSPSASANGNSRHSHQYGHSSHTINTDNNITSSGLDGGSASEDDSDSDCINVNDDHDTSSSSSRAAVHDVDEYDDEEDSYVVADTYVPGGGGVFEEAKEVALNVLRRDSIVGTMAQSFVLDSDGNRGHTAGMERSGTTVTATTDMVVYAWDMHLLRAFIKRRPLAGAAVMKAISADLIRKVDQSRGPEERYRLLLAEALDGGVITPIEKKKLNRYRDLHGISLAEHKELLKEYEWREEEFEAGFQKGVAPRDGSKHFLAYEALVRRELAKGEVQEKGRENLRNFRAQAGIDAQEHLIALEKQGWTADDYEVGGKGKAAGLAENESMPISMGVVRLETKTLSEEEGELEKGARQTAKEGTAGGAAAKRVGQGASAQGDGPPTILRKASTEAETVRKMTNRV